MTTVRQRLAELGRMGVSLLSRLIDGQRLHAIRVELANELVVRRVNGSCSELVAQPDFGARGSCRESSDEPSSSP